MEIVRGLIGMAVIMGLAYALSTDRRAIRPRTVLGALAIQVLFGVMVLYWPAGQRALEAVSSGIQAVINSANAGIEFVFGAALPEDGNVFAFQVLPVIVFFASLTAVLYHLNVLQLVVQVLGGGLQKLLHTSRAESISATANIFVGQTEAPLVVRPYLAGMTRSEFFAVMTGGLASVAGSVLVGYSLLGAPLEYLIAAAFMAAPAGLLMAKMVVPETEDRDLAPDGGRDGRTGGRTRETVGDTTAATTGDDTADDRTDDDADDESADEQPRPSNVIEAAAQGASDGLQLALNVGAMLVAFISLIALLNLMIGGIGGLFGQPDLSFQLILGWLFAPLMFAIGVPWSEAIDAGSFLGQKLVLNEFVAFQAFAPEIDQYSPRTAAIITFTLTGFANFGSLAILLGGLGQLVPKRRSQIARYGVRAVLAATLANLMSATIAGMLIG